ncbi:unnamed protein product [Penicillium roqueforti FM164]|uniref:Uncharacterized protein n=1 Tax=Penicillium roqueforti (strain FM164) TaxID=1365484 RepID=W6QQ08_PENRF|nr:unnamed protein product [Penicillium roqueforti FM164]
MAQRMIEDLISVMEGGLEFTQGIPTDRKQVLEVSINLFSGVKAPELVSTNHKKVPKGVQKRFVKYMNEFCQANLGQVKLRPSGNIGDIDELTNIQRELICTTPILVNNNLGVNSTWLEGGTTISGLPLLSAGSMTLLETKSPDVIIELNYHNQAFARSETDKVFTSGNINLNIFLVHK